MLKFRVIICDDEVDKAKRLKEMLGTEIFEYDIIDAFGNLNETINTNDYDVLFLDLYYFNEDLNEYKILNYENLQNVRKVLTNKRKLIIYTKHTSDEIDLLRKAAIEGIIDEWIDEKDIYEEGLKADEAIIRINKAIGVRSREQSFLSVYHFSDLHFGKQYKYLEDEIGDFLIEQIKDQITLIQNNETKLDIDIPKLVTISGDFTHICSTDQLEQARRFLLDLEDMLKEFKVTSPVIALCTGNHDFNWDDSIAQENQVSKAKKAGETIKIVPRAECNDEYIKSLKWFRFQKHYEDIIDKFSTSNNFPYWIYYDYTERLGFKVYSINTAIDMTYKDGKVKVHRHSLEELYQIVKKEKSCTGLLICHHPLNEWGDETTLEELKKFLYNKLKVRVILSGHKHSNNIIPHRLESNKYIYEIKTGSLSVVESEMDVFKLPSYRILKFLKNSEENWAKLKSFTFEYRDGNYRPRTDEKGYTEEDINLDL